MKHIYTLFRIFFLSLLFSFSIINAQSVTIEIVSPADAAQFAIGSNITFTVATTVEANEIKTVRIYQNGNSIGLINLILHPDERTLTWNNVPSGVFVMHAVATDTLNNTFNSDSITINVGGVQANDLIINGQFSGPMTGDAPFPWNLDWYEGALASLDIESIGYFEQLGLTNDSSSAYIQIQEVGAQVWGVQLMQRFKLQQGHTYHVYFVAWAAEEKPIQVTFSRDYDDYGTWWYTDINLTAEPQEYGPYTYVCDVDDPQIMFKFILGGNTTALFLDNVRILDGEISTAIESAAGFVADDFKLNQNYPNPFNPQTTIGYSLSKSMDIDLSIYNLLGQKVATLAKGSATAGYHQVVWDAAGFAGGVYFYRLTGNPGLMLTRKLLLVK